MTNQAITSLLRAMNKSTKHKSTETCDRGLFDQKSVDQNCVFSVDRNFCNQLTEILDAFQLIKSFNNEFDQTPKI